MKESSVLEDINAQYIIDKNGKKTAVILNVDTFNQLLEELEDAYLGKIAEKMLEQDKESHSLDNIKKEISESNNKK